jgi:hypothetical protein
MGGLATYNGEEGEQTMLAKKHVPEGTVTEEVAEDLLKLGWVSSEWPDDKQ